MPGRPLPILRARWLPRDGAGAHISALSHTDTKCHLSTSHTWVAPVPKPYLPPPVPGPTQEPCRVELCSQHPAHLPVGRVRVQCCSPDPARALSMGAAPVPGPVQWFLNFGGWRGESRPSLKPVKRFELSPQKSIPIIKFLQTASQAASTTEAYSCTGN